MKTALVTGGAKGIGAAAVKKLCENGFSVAINYLSSEEKAFALSSALISAGFDVFTVKADVSDAGQVDDMISAVLSRNGRLDVLVNNAGIAKQQLFDTVTDADWQKMLGCDLTGVFNCCRACLPHMLQAKKGRIINVSSMWGQVGASCEVSYSAAKAGVIGLTKALAKEVGLSGVTVNCVAPGAIETDMMAQFSDDDIRTLCEEIPLGRLGKPEEAAELIAFLASDKASYITGQVIGVNGGMVV